MDAASQLGDGAAKRCFARVVYSFAVKPMPRPFGAGVGDWFNIGGALSHSESDGGRRKPKSRVPFPE